MSQRGRPRTFDRDEALTSAMHLFWEHGFDSTSLSQLKAAMGGGISAPSFYAAFESKEALYREALELYVQIYSDVTRSLHDESIPPRDAVYLAMHRSAEMQCGRGHPKGCMVVLGTMGAWSSRNQDAGRLLREVRDRTRAGFGACVERGIKRGELRKTTDAKSLGAAFDGMFLGISVMARDSVPFAMIEKAILESMAMWDAAGEDRGLKGSRG